MSAFTFIYPWRIEVRQTAFHPWATFAPERHLTTAVTRVSILESIGKFYAVRIRAN